MIIHPVTAVRHAVSPAAYRRIITAKYDEAEAVINSFDQPPLTDEVFEEFGIRTLGDLSSYLSRRAEYGGYISVPFSEKLVLIPFHNDFMNRWLRFDNPRVTAFYDRLYEERKSEFDSRQHFDRARFRIEEEFQLNAWRMPPLDKRMLLAPISGCWDKPELLAHFLTLKGYPVKRLSCNDGNNLRGHCFCVYYDGKYWRPAGRYPIKNRDYKKLCRAMLDIFRRVPMFKHPDRCRLMEFGAPETGFTGREYVALIDNGSVVVQA